MAKRSEKLESALDKIIPGGGPAEQQDSRPVERQDSGATDKIKATYYINRDLVKKLKYAGVDTGRDLSDLVNEAIGDLLIKLGH